ncbi:type II secretion system F family protein [Candidatus Micrarchaeota archaeon]|nr:type II secretion system F family protein [Candidatus Micrarchaeota archaeon]
MIDTLVDLSLPLPKLPLTSPSLRYLTLLSKKSDSQKYLSLVFVLSLSISLIFIIAFQTFSIPVFLIIFSILSGLFLLFPKFQYLKILSEMEAELPFYLKDLSVLLEMGIPFEAALKHAASENPFSKKFIESVSDSSSSIQKSLSNFAIKSESTLIKRGVSQIISVYEHGTGADFLSKTADDILAIQRHSNRLASSRAAVLGLIYTVFSTITPTFFIIYLSLNEILFHSNLDTFSIISIMLVVFPLINLLIVLSSFSLIPRSTFSKEFHIDLSSVLLVVLLSLILFLVPDLFSYALIPILGLFIYKHFVSSRGETKIVEIENKLPDALLSLSTLPKGASPEKCLYTIEHADYGELSKEIAVSLNQLKSNISIENVLLDFSKRNNSKIISRFCFLLLYCFNTGSINQASNLANDLLKFFEVIRERSQLFSMQRYTLILGSIIIPLIILLSLSITSTIPLSSSVFDKSFLINLVLGYLIIYSFVSSMFLSYIEGDGSKNLTNLTMLLGLSLITFYLSNIIILQ